MHEWTALLTCKRGVGGSIPDVGLIDYGMRSLRFLFYYFFQTQVFDFVGAPCSLCKPAFYVLLGVGEA